MPPFQTSPLAALIDVKNYAFEDVVMNTPITGGFDAN
jgi:hypothetical protein